MANLSKTFDPSKFQKSITKSIKGISTGFNDPDTWISTGNYALNKRISGDFKKGIPLGKVSLFSGQSGCVISSTNVSVIKYDGEFRKPSEDITVAELKQMYIDKEMFFINTPDGPQKITNWFNKGKMKIVKIMTENHSLTCSHNHMIQKSDETWSFADSLKEDDEIITISGNEKVIKVIDKGEDDVYDFTVDHQNHRYWADGISSHNSGKSFIVSGSIVKHAQEQGIFCVIIDTENALDEQWLKAVGVDTSADKLLRISASMIGDVAGIVSGFINEYKDNYGELPREERPKVLFVIDSLGMLLSDNDVKQFQNADLKGDMGIRAKQIKAFMTNVTNMLGDLNIGLAITNHSYQNQDIYNGEGSQINSGGASSTYSSSILVMMKKLKLKTDEDGKKTSEVHGIRAGCEVIKTRYAKPFEKIELEIPYSTGLDPYSGMFDYIKSKSVLEKSGIKWVYYDKENNEHKYSEKEYNKNTNGILDLIMDEWDSEKEHRNQIDFKEMEEIDES